MKELEQDGGVSLDVQFGSISFVQKDADPYALVSVLVTVQDRDRRDGEDRVTLDIGFPADPAADTIMKIVEKSRLAVIERLSVILRRLEGTTPTELLFGEESEPS